MTFTWQHRMRAIAGTITLPLAMSIAAIGCKTEDPTITDPPIDPVDSAPLTSVDPVAESSDFWAPLDASPSPNGDRIYFTAMTPDGSAVLTVTPGDQPTVLAVGGLLASPFSVIPSLDGQTLYITDSGAEGDTDVTGRLFSMPAGGGEPTAISAADGTMPKSMTIVELDGAEKLYFTGVDPNDETMPAVMQMNADGSGFSVVHSGDPLVDPSGIAVRKDGTIFVADSDASADGAAAIVMIASGSASLFVEDLRTGFPAGIALDFNETALFVSGLEKDAPSSVVYHIVLDSKEITSINDGIAQNSESAGVHRAHNADVYAWANADGSEAEPAGGTVYLLKGPDAP